MLLTGWKDLTNFCGFSRGTIVRLIQEDNFPVTYIARKPVATIPSITKWVESRFNLSNKPKSSFEGLSPNEIRERMCL